MAEEETGAAEDQGQQFVLQRIYIKDLSFESPEAPDVFRKEWNPKMGVDLNTRSTSLGDDNFEVVLTVTVTAKLEEETAFLIEIQQAGIFLVRGIEGEDLRRVLATMCPSTLFPYAREAIDSVIARGTFPALMLAPVNFDMLYLQAVQQSQQKAGEEGAQGSPAGEPTH
jgi:preprotein translocase subunit SecB